MQSTAPSVIIALAAAALCAPAAHAQDCPGLWHNEVGQNVFQREFASVPITSLLTLPDGDVIAAGDFLSIGNVPANHIARYHPATNTWSPLGAGLQVSLGNFLMVYIVTTLLPDGSIVVGGTFDTAGGQPANKLARYIPATNTWTPLGTSVTSSRITTVASLPGGDVIVGGDIQGVAGQFNAHNIARYSPATGLWSPLGSGTNNAVHAVTILPGGDIVASGAFSLAGGVPAQRIARFSFSTGAWSALGAGIGYEYGYTIEVCTLPNGNIVAGGGFDQAGGMPTRRIASYDFTTGLWSPLGVGISGSPTATSSAIDRLLTLADGTVAVAGEFATAGGIQTGAVARYSFAQNAWLPLSVGPSGNNTYVLALAQLPNGDLLTGGLFNNAGGMPANSIARYSFGPTADFNNDGDSATDADIEAFFACLSGNCCNTCPLNADFNNDGDAGTDADIEAFFRVLAGGPC